MLSYSLGAKNISDVLDGVPQFDSLSIVFSPGLDDNPHRVESPFPVLRVNYSNSVPSYSSSNDSVERGFYDPTWGITVGAVPRALRHAVKTVLVAEALPRVRQWLVTKADATGQEGHAWVRVWYDADAERLTYKTASRLR